MLLRDGSFAAGIDSLVVSVAKVFDSAGSRCEVGLFLIGQGGAPISLISLA
jgi:hypothetical protein